MKPGRLLEITLRIVQESLKDRDTTIITSNHKLIDETGNKREFDIAIDAKINNFDFLTVIECKDYKRPIQGDKIEAFHSKCLQFPQINKKIFVSRNGFQIGAKNIAKRFGIELYKIDQINAKLVNDWFAVSMITPAKRSLHLNELSIIVNPKLGYSGFTFDSILYTKKNEKIESLLNFTNNLIRKIGLLDETTIIKSTSESINKKENYFLDVNPNKEIFLFSSKNTKHRLKKLEVSFSLITKELQSKVSIEMIKSENKEMSTVVTHDTTESKQIKLVLKDNNPNEFKPFIINKTSGEIEDIGYTIKYEEIIK